jgi:hypothetical protein
MIFPLYSRVALTLPEPHLESLHRDEVLSVRSLASHTA